MRAGKLSHLIKEIKQGRDQIKVGKKEAPAKDKSLTIYMVQPWHRMIRQKVTQSFAHVSKITFPLRTTSKGTEGLLVIEVEIGLHMIHRMYVDGGSSTEVLYEHCFNWLGPKIKSQMVSATTSLTGFSRETIWPLGKLRLLITIGDVDHSTKAWMNFMILRSLSPYNGIIRRPKIREIQAVPSTAHRMLKFLIDEGIVTIRSTILIPAECTTMTTSSKETLKEAEPSDMTGVPRSVAEHRLNIREGYSPIQQKKRGQALERAKAIQVEMVESDEEKTAFHTSQGVYCYTKMPFGLKNAGATYQWLMDNVFDSQVGQNIEVPERIKPCPDKTEAVLQFPCPRTIKEAQSLNGKLASLNIFLSKSAEKSLPLFKTLKKCIKKSDFHWTPKAEQAFKQLKQHLLELPLLVAPKPKKELIVYMSASYGAISRSSCVDGSGAGLILTSPEGTEFSYVLRFQFTASNNEAENEALIDGLQIAVQMGVRNVHVSVDSNLVTNQILRTYVAKEENMAKYLEKAKSLISGFANFFISQVLVEVLKEKSIQEEEVATVVDEEGPTWITPIMEYLKDGTIPDDRKEASKLRIKARQYKLLEGVLYRRSFLKLWLRNPQQPLTPITAPWPFYKWGINIAGPFPEGPRKVKFFIVAIDYFTKWIEVKAVATITVNQAHRTMIKSSHGDTPFSLTYGKEAVIPVEIRMPTYRTMVVDAVHNDKELRLNLDLLEERRERTAIRKAKAKLKMTKYYNARVRGVTFRPKDFVYHSNEACHAMDGGKLGPKWEGPYEVMEALGDGAYWLRSMDVTILPRTWNITNLKECYL
ncbi:reverse transcriptase domain-containing protein [Tanacetum coccineum]